MPPANDSIKVQALLFPVELFTPVEAQAWARNHRFKAPLKLHSTYNYHRLRLAEPNSKRYRYRTSSLPGTSGIKAIYQIPKTRPLVSGRRTKTEASVTSLRKKKSSSKRSSSKKTSKKSSGKSKSSSGKRTSKRRTRSA